MQLKKSWTYIVQHVKIHDGLCSYYYDKDLDFYYPIQGGAPMEIHHPNGRKGENFNIFYHVTQPEHDIIHYGRRVR